MSFFGELRRRNVFRVGIAYLAAAWLLVQVADLVLSNFDSPAWIIQALIFSTALGFPLTLVLAWFYELTPEGIKAASDVEAVEAVRFTGRKIDFVIIGLLVLAVGFLLLRSPLESRGSVLPNSVAVLPFENLSPDPDNSYFAAGIHEETLNQLAKLENLSVISRTSVLRYQDTNLSIPEIAAELNVGTVMEGSVRYAEDRVRITAQLIDASTDEHLWSDVYERDFADIFAIQSDIAMNIANALEAEFSPEEQRRIETIPTTSEEAYALYLQAVSFGVGNASSLDLINAALDLLNRATLLDPDFAAAYVRIARVALSYPHMETFGFEESYALARTHAEKALTIDPSLGSAYAVLGRIHIDKRDPLSAGEALSRAYELSPNDAEVLDAYAEFNSRVGNYTEAIRLAERRFALGGGVALGHALLLGGEYARATEYYERQTELNPADPNARLNRSRLASRRGDYEEAQAQMRIATQLVGEENLINDGGFIWAYSFGLAQDRVTALELFNRISPPGFRTRSSIFHAIGNLGIGNRETALEMLREVADNPAEHIFRVEEAILHVNAFGDPVLDQPEFVEVRLRLGFSE